MSSFQNLFLWKKKGGKNRQWRHIWKQFSRQQDYFLWIFRPIYRAVLNIIERNHKKINDFFHIHCSILFWNDRLSVLSWYHIYPCLILTPMGLSTTDVSEHMKKCLFDFDIIKKRLCFILCPHLFCVKCFHKKKKSFCYHVTLRWYFPKKVDKRQKVYIFDNQSNFFPVTCHWDGWSHVT